MAKQENIHFSITADNDDIKQKLAETRQGILNSGKSAQTEGTKIEAIFNRISAAKIDPFSADTINELVEITSKFQAFETVLANAIQSPLDANELLKPSEWEATFGDLDTLSNSSMERLIASVTAKADAMVACGEISADTYKKIMEVIAKADQEMQSRNPFVSVIESAKVAFEEIDKEDNAAVEKRKNAWRKMGIAMGESIAVVAQVSQGVGAIAESLGASEEMQTTVSQITGALSGAASLAKGIATGDISSIINGAVGMITSMIDLFDFRSKNATKLIQMEQENLNKLKSEYKTLESSVDNAIGKDYYTKKLAMIDNYETQIDLKERQIEEARKIRKKEEREKKIAAFEEERSTLIAQSNTLVEDLKKEIMTTDLKTLASSLSGSIVDGLVNGTKGIDEVSKIIDGKLDQLIQNMIIKRLEAEVVQNELKELFRIMEKATDKNSPDGVQFSNEELKATKSAATGAKNRITGRVKTFIDPLQKSGLLKIGNDNSKNSQSKDQSENIQAKIKKEEQEKIRLYKEMEFSVRQAEIDAASDGIDKVLKQNKLDYDREIEQIKRQKEDKLAKIQTWERTIWESKNSGGETEGLKSKPKTIPLSKDDEVSFKILEDKAGDKFKNKNTTAYTDELNRYSEFATQYIAKKKEFDENIKNLQNQSENSLSIDDQEVMEKNIASVTAMQNNILSGLDEQIGVKNQIFVSFVEGMVDKGLQELLNALAVSEAALNSEISSGKDNPENAERLKGEIAVLRTRILQLSKDKNTDSAEKPDNIQIDPAKKWKDTLSVMNGVKGITTDIISNFSGLDDSTKQVLNAAMDVATGIISMIIGITTLTTGTAVAMTSTSNVAASSIIGVERASVILAIISAALQVVMAIVNVVTGLFNNDKKKETEISNLQKQVDSLSTSYESLEKAIDDAYSKDASNLIKQQDANLLNQKKLIEEQKRLEEDKKDTDDGKINDYNQALDNINLTLEENKKKAVDVVFGSDLKGAIDDFASAYIDAWSGGEDKAAAQKDVVKKMIQNVISEMIKSNISGKVKELRESILAAISNDDQIDAYEQKRIDKITNDIYAQSEKDSKWANKYMNGSSGATQQSASSKGFETMTQETAGELNGSFFSMRNNMSLAKDVLIQLNETARMMLWKMNNGENLSNTPRLIAIAVWHLEAIQRNTSHLEEMKNDLKQVKNNTARL